MWYRLPSWSASLRPIAPHARQRPRLRAGLLRSILPSRDHRRSSTEELSSGRARAKRRRPQPPLCLRTLRHPLSLFETRSPSLSRRGPGPREHRFRSRDDGPLPDPSPWERGGKGLSAPIAGESEHCGPSNLGVQDDFGAEHLAIRADARVDIRGEKMGMVKPPLRLLPSRSLWRKTRTPRLALAAPLRRGSLHSRRFVSFPETNPRHAKDPACGPPKQRI